MNDLPNMNEQPLEKLLEASMGENGPETSENKENPITQTNKVTKDQIILPEEETKYYQNGQIDYDRDGELREIRKT